MEAIATRFEAIATRNKEPTTSRSKGIKKRQRLKEENESKCSADLSPSAVAQVCI